MKFLRWPIVGATALTLLACVATSNSNSAHGLNKSTSPWVVVPSSSAMVHEMPEVPFQTVSFETTEGTFMSVDVSPDGETIVFDLLGDIYSMPIAGGEAIPLTAGRAWDKAPRFSPDGSEIYFVSDREDLNNLWRLSLVDQSLRQITRAQTDLLGHPNWSQDGSHLLVGFEDLDLPGIEVILHAISPSSGAVTPIDLPPGPSFDVVTRKSLRVPYKAYSGVESSDGMVFFSEPTPGVRFSNNLFRLSRFDPTLQARVAITPPDAPYSDYKPQLSHDGTLLAYFRYYNGQRTDLRVLNLTTGRDEAVVALTDTDLAGYMRRDNVRPNWAFTPDDQSVIFWHLGKIHRVELADGSMEIIPFRVAVEREVTPRLRPKGKRLDDEARTIRWPSFSSDGQTLVFSAFGYVWVRDMATGEDRRLSDSLDIEYMPTISPDGLSVAYISFDVSDDDYGRGRLMVADIQGRKHREILADPEVDYLLPRWSPDGSMIALIQEVDRTDGRKMMYGWTPATAGAFHGVASATEYMRRASYVSSRHISFNAAGDKLLFSYPKSDTEFVLVVADIHGGERKTIIVGTSDVIGIAPAPDLKSLALTRRDWSVWIVPFDVGDKATSVSTLAPDASRASRNAGHFVQWNGHEQLTFVFGKDLYHYRLDSGALKSVRINVSAPRPAAPQTVAFTGARLITMSGDAGPGRIIEPGTVVVNGTRIVAIGPTGDVAIPANAQIIVATGKTIIPGFIDTHYHSMRGGGTPLVLPDPDNADPTAIMFGVTSAWIPGGRLADASPANADLQKAGRILGPRVSYSSWSVSQPKEFITSYSAARAAALRQRELGVGVTKEFSTPTRQQRQWLSVAAHEVGIGMVSHLDSFSNTMTRAIDGYTGGDHPSMPDSFYKDAIEILRQTGFIWTPDIVINPTAGIADEDDDKERFYCAAIVEKQKQGELGPRATDSICDLDRPMPTAASFDVLRVNRMVKGIALAASRGVTIGASAHNAPGSDLHREMWLLSKGGMPIAEVLRSATMVNAEKMGQQAEIGSLEVGKMADFLVLDENPLDDILNTLSLKYTVQGGVVYDSATTKRVDVAATAARTQN